MKLYKKVIVGVVVVYLAYVMMSLVIIDSDSDTYTAITQDDIRYKQFECQYETVTIQEIQQCMKEYYIMVEQYREQYRERNK